MTKRGSGSGSLHGQTSTEDDDSEDDRSPSSEGISGGSGEQRTEKRTGGKMETTRDCWNLSNKSKGCTRIVLIGCRFVLMFTSLTPVGLPLSESTYGGAELRGGGCGACKFS